MPRPQSTRPLAQPAPAPGLESDSELLGRWLAGDGAAFTTLVASHSGALLVHARSLLRDPAAAEDAVQEAFMKLLARPPEVRELSCGDFDSQRSQLSSWLHRVTHNLCMDLLRSESRRKRREAGSAQPDLTDGGQREVERNDTRSAVERGLAKLPAEQREVLALRLLNEQSYREIAQITGKKIGTVGWLIAEGLKALSRDLAHLLPDSQHPHNPERAR